jgi:serine/threonine-protein kinase
MLLAGTYKLLRVIGEGAMGRVYEARHVRLASKRFAIKVLHGDLTRQAEVVERFLREADSTSALNHPNIVGVLDVNLVPDGRPYIVAELLQGDQLGDYLARKGKLSVSESVAICRQICQALTVAHAHGIVHRDIKPENLFLVGKGEGRIVKVLDFGISRVSDSSATLTKAGMVLGTPAYMPPEQANGTRVDHRADIYSVGAILYEAVTGRRPFDDTDPIATLGAVLTREPTRPCTLNNELSPALEHLIQKCMAKKRDERFQSMDELDEALSEFDVPEESLTKLELPTERHMRVSLPPIQLPTSMVHALNRSGRPMDDVRAELVLVSLASALTGLLTLFELSSSVVRLTRGGEPLSGSEVGLAFACSAGLLIAPVLLGLRLLSERVWSSTPRVMCASVSISRVLVTGLMAYAFSMLLIRVGTGVLRAEAGVSGWAGWDLLTVILGLGAAVHAYVHEWRRSAPRERQSSP